MEPSEVEDLLDKAEKLLEGNNPPEGLEELYDDLLEVQDDMDENPEDKELQSELDDLVGEIQELIGGEAKEKTIDTTPLSSATSYITKSFY